MNCVFSYCNSLVSLPDISKWNISEISGSYESNGINYCEFCGVSFKLIPESFNLLNNSDNY